jgi:hypothetical protein
MVFARDDYLRRLLLRLRSECCGSGGLTRRSFGTGRWDRKRLLLPQRGNRRLAAEERTPDCSFSVHHPANDQPRGYYKDQTKRAHHEAHLFAVAMEFGGHRRDGVRRDWSPARGTETPFHRLSALAAKHHFCTSIRRNFGLCAIVRAATSGKRLHSEGFKGFAVRRSSGPDRRIDTG